MKSKSRRPESASGAAAGLESQCDTGNDTQADHKAQALHRRVQAEERRRLPYLTARLPALTDRDLLRLTVVWREQARGVAP